MPTATAPSPPLNSREVARLLGIGIDTLHHLDDGGQIPGFRTPTGYRRYRPADLERYLGEPDARGGWQPLLTTAQVARYLRVHPKSIRRWARDGDLVEVRVGSVPRYRPADLDAWLDPAKAVR
ncbi:helix-turn-helix domain-containing protein [Nocardiopsis synnemataformans]|uniref:helix-turn-helix domain-containing protein n=1 Tax=Nocardiopsis synnemataformans TaxID=61305 RepID=UPI003EB69FD1